jgi:hypothetical protein
MLHMRKLGADTKEADYLPVAALAKVSDLQQHLEVRRLIRQVQAPNITGDDLIALAAVASLR